MDYLNYVSVYTDTSIKNAKKSPSKKYYIRELLNHRGKFSKDIYEAVYNGDVTKIAAIYDLKIKEIGKEAFEKVLIGLRNKNILSMTFIFWLSS